ncbi:interferon alpha/beta receptor 1 isoform X2 [Pseudonaja textilis]|uniref:interferon alpha/beta receptor 1 isoform X2 n=1 Tax=Pseudonaja textilis TaxID=8673 RepID=UPI000EA96A37|nr:interferon alpha/beta receptor 1 isoform X2 [Pseudonaja textilis]
MEGARLWLVVAAVLGMGSKSTGLTCLEPPQNVTTSVINANITLKWDWDNPCGLNVTFSVQYPRRSEIWAAIPQCQNITITECDLSSTISDYLASYKVAIRANTLKNHSPYAFLEFTPYIEAQVGPPGVWFESIYGDVKINILHPEADQKKMWKQDTLKYQLTIWKNATHSKEKTQSIFPGEIIYDLEPETTYCLKVKAHMEDHISFYSPMHCIQTSKVWIGLLRLQNLQMDSLNMKHLLRWDDLYDGNVSFIVQLLHGYKARHSPDISKDWENVSKCENIQTTFCNLSSVIGSSGIFYLRVQAVHNHNKSPWSKTLEFKPIDQTKMGPPNVSVSASKDSIKVFIASPGESENRPMSDIYDLTYNVWYRTSSITKELRHKSPQFIISNLNSSTLYCLKAQAFSDTYNKSSAFSNETCIKTAKGESSSFIPGIISAVVFFIICLFPCAWGGINYARFPKCKTPAVIENFGEKDLKRLYFPIAEEQTDKCMVINSSVALPCKVNLDDVRFDKELEEISQDSGNYFIDDIISGDNESHQSSELIPV